MHYKTPRVQCKKYINTAYETNKFEKYCVTMAYLSLIYFEKSVKIYSGNLGHLTMSNRYFSFLKVVVDAIKMSMTFLFFIFCCMSIAPRNHIPTLGIITPQPWGLPPNPEDLRPFPLVPKDGPEWKRLFLDKQARLRDNPNS